MPFCNQCGKEYSLGEEKCSKCGKALPVAPAQLALDDKPKEFLNPKLKRFVAGVIDLSLTFAIVFFLFFSRRLVIALLFRRGLALIFPNLYLLLKDSIEGKSIGKLLMGILVYNEKEKKPGGLLDSIIRNWYLAIPILGPTLLAVVIGAEILSGKKKRMGDKGAGTLVIADSDYQKVV
jgi:rRNA maturation protein Nop10